MDSGTQALYRLVMEAPTESHLGGQVRDPIRDYNGISSSPEYSHNNCVWQRPYVAIMMVCGRDPSRPIIVVWKRDQYVATEIFHDRRTYITILWSCFNGPYSHPYGI